MSSSNVDSTERDLVSRSVETSESERKCARSWSERPVFSPNRSISPGTVQRWSWPSVSTP